MNCWPVRWKRITESLRCHVATVKLCARQHHLPTRKLQLSEPLVTEFGSVIDAFNPEENIEVTTAPEGIRLLPTNDEIWLSPDGAKKMIDLLRTALSSLPTEAQG